MKVRISAAVMVALVAIVGTQFDLTAAPPVASIPVTFTFADDPAHKIASDLLGPYQNGSGVSANIMPGSNGELLIFSKASKTVAARRFWLTFDDCIGTCYDVPSVSMPTTVVQLMVGVRQPDGTHQPGGMLTMPIDAPGYRAGLKVYLGSIDSAQWTLCMTPGDAGGFCANSIGSTPTRIVRTAAASWTVSADAVLPRSDLGVLITETGNGRSTTITRQGTFAMPFAMTVQCVNAANCPAP